MIVMKFGGTSVGSAREILRVTELVSREKRKKVVVVSAMGGVTDKLDKMARKVVNLPTEVVESEVEKFHKEILDQHVSAIKEAVKDAKAQEEVLKEVSTLASSLRYALMGIGYLEDLSPRSLDYIWSFGERMSAPIVAGALRSKGVKAKHMTGYEAGLVTNSCFGQARPIFKKLDKTIKEALNPVVEKGIVPVVTGFIAADEEAKMTTLGRGGSDYTASIIGRYLNVEEVQIWTDVDGILTTDPRIVPNAKQIYTISYVEAMDLAYFGAKVIHSKMIEPAMDADIPVRIKNTFNPDNVGTLVVKESEQVEGVVKAISIAKNVAIINLKGVGLADTPNIAATVFNLLGESGINIIMISAASEANLSFVVKRSDVQAAVNILNTEFFAGCIRTLEVIEDACIIAVVGAGMRGTHGIAAKIFQTAADVNANIIMIAQGSSEVNISFMVKENEGDPVLKALHRNFIENAKSARK